MRAAGLLATLGLLLSGIDAYADVLIRNVNVYDGTSGPPFAADVRIHGDRIAASAPRRRLYTHCSRSRIAAARISTRSWRQWTKSSIQVA
jgi:adenine deaminase